MITLTAKTTLDDGTPIVIDKKNVISIDFGIVDRGEISLPTWGIMSNSGRIDFVDVDGKIKNYAYQRRVYAGLPVEIYLTDNLYGTKKTFSNFVTGDWQYDSNNRQVSVSITDELEEMQNVPIAPKIYRQTTTEATGRAIYDYLYKATPTKFKFKTFNELESTTRTVLNNFTVPIFILNDKNVWASWVALCQFVHAHIFKNSEGETTFVCHD